MKNIFATICKVNEEERMVYGYASTEAMDVQGEQVSKSALENALPEYMKFANIREMHQASAVGVAKTADIDEKGLYLSVKVVDDTAWNKVKEGVYKGFSIGGKTISKVGDVIKELRLSEISLVDRPANPEAVIELWKSDMNEETNEQTQAQTQGDLTKYIGEEVYDASIAFDALSDILWLFEREASEKENETETEQLALLTTVINALKAFIASEISEPLDIDEESAVIQYAEKVDDLLKAGKTISSANMEKLQAMHDSIVGFGAKCSKGDDIANAEEIDDLSKSDDTIALDEASTLLSKMASFEQTLEKMNSEITLLKSENEALKAMPAPAKAILKAVGKSDDQIIENDAVSSAMIVKDGGGEVNEAASLIKMIHQNHGLIK